MDHGGESNGNGDRGELVDAKTRKRRRHGLEGNPEPEFENFERNEGSGLHPFDIDGDHVELRIRHW